MDLSVAGLNETESKCYLALLESDEWKPSELGRYIGITRTNSYKVLESLEDKGLVERTGNGKTLSFRATHPARLVQLSNDKKREHEDLETKLKIDLEALITTYAKSQDSPGIRMYYGKDEIKQIFVDIAESKTPVYFISTIAGIDFYGYEHMHHLRMMAVRNRVMRYALTPDTSLATMDYRVTDKQFHLHRTWLEYEDYIAPVEWGTFDDKLYIISFGKDAMGVVIQSPFIAAGFLQLFKLIQRGQLAKSDYEKLPKLAHTKAWVDV